MILLVIILSLSSQRTNASMFFIDQLKRTNENLGYYSSLEELLSTKTIENNTIITLDGIVELNNEILFDRSLISIQLKINIYFIKEKYIFF
jgi:hypothetical protein